MGYYDREEKRALGHGPRRSIEERLRASNTVPDHAFRPALDGTCIYDGLSEKAHVPIKGADTAGPQDKVDAKKVREHSGAMIALFPDETTAQQLALEDGEDPNELHVTLVFLGKASDLTGREDELTQLVSDFAEANSGLSGEVSGLGLFTAGPQPVTYASVDLPNLPKFRQDLVQLLEDAGFDLPSAHGYTPHMTLAYADRRDHSPQNVGLNFNSITLAIGGLRSEFPLSGPQAEAAAVHTLAPYKIEQRGQKYVVLNNAGEVKATFDTHDQALAYQRALYANVPGAAKRAAKKKFTGDEPKPKWAQDAGAPGDPAPHEYKHPAGQEAIADSPVLPPCDECQQEATSEVHTDHMLYDTDGDGEADVNEMMQPVNQKSSSLMLTINDIQVPSVADVKEAIQRAFVTQHNGHTLITGPATYWERALSPNPHMTWIQGRFVGGEKANRNGAFWSTQDLEFGQPTVQYGPLNWLHEARHIIGSIADARLVTPGEQSADGPAEPHIVAAAGVWNWIYPDEAYVIEQASEANKLWYSMECISETVQCMGDNGCGAEVAYADYMRGQGGTCQHMIERASTRRFINPTFLGGAVIVPPVRPGWAEADASVIREASALAERSFEVANPDMPASEWEQLMAQVITYAS